MDTPIIVKLENLFLDPNNYRLRSDPNYIPVDHKSILKPAIQKRTFNMIAGENNYKINDLIESIKINGYLKVDNILVRRYDSTNNYFVIEGNRRLASLKALKEQYEAGYEIGKVKPKIFNSGIETVVYHYSNEKDYLILMGLKHVSGNKKWDYYNQAKLVYELRQSGESIGDIAKKISITKSAVELQIRGYLAIQDFLKEIEGEAFKENFDPHEKLQMFIDLTTKPKLKKWIGWNENSQKLTNKENKKRFFSWIIPLVEWDEETGREEFKEPIIVSHKEVRELENIIDDEEALQYMEDTRNFEQALNQNANYTRKKVSHTIKTAEAMMKNIPIGTASKLTNEDKKSLRSIKNISENLLHYKVQHVN